MCIERNPISLLSKSNYAFVPRKHAHTNIPELTHALTSCFCKSVENSMKFVQETRIIIVLRFVLFKGFCKNQDVCYMYGTASWDEALAVCPLLHPNARMIQEKSDEEGSRHIAEAG